MVHEEFCFLYRIYRAEETGGVREMKESFFKPGGPGILF